MKSLPSSRSWMLVGILILCFVLCAGCSILQNPKTSASPGLDTSATTAPAAQAQGTPSAPPAPTTETKICRSGLTDCSGFCRDLSIDIGNCGACGVSCPSGQTCNNGKCTLSCKGGKTACSGACVDLTTDPKNCGACGIACPGGQVCNGGQCGVKCINNLVYCNGQCRDLSADTANCGACGVSCPSGQTCQKGQCGAMCGSGLAYCNGYCRNLYTDSSSCGSCGVTCASGSTCQNGICTLTPVAPVHSWTGHWTIHTYSDSDMNLVEDPNTHYVGGAYRGGRGRISGTTSSTYPPIFSGTWSWDNGAPGQVSFSMSFDGQSFTGSYFYPGQTTPNLWTGRRS